MSTVRQVLPACCSVIGLNAYTHDVFMFVTVVALQLGDGTLINRNAPSAVVLTGVTAVTVGDLHTCAVMASLRGVRCWGDNQYGQASDFVCDSFNWLFMRHYR